MNMKATNDLDVLRVKEQGNMQLEFKRIAFELFNNYLIFKKSDEKEYRLVDIEFYFLAPWHQDFFIYGKEEQQNFGKWLAHPSGMDFAIGDNDKKYYGGILIRGIREVTGEQKFINGPLNLRDTLSQKDQPVSSNSLNSNVSLKQNLKTRNELILESGRVGLTIQSLYAHYKHIIKTDSTYDSIIPSKHEDFIHRRYRFVTDICPKNQFKEKERVARTSVNAGICTSGGTEDVFCE